MSQIFTNSLAVCAALLLTVTSIGTIVAVPPAQTAIPVQMTQLA